MTKNLVDFWWEIGFSVLGVLLVGLAVFYYWRGRARLQEAGSSWTRTQGRIISSSVERMTQYGTYPSAHWLVRRGATTYFPHVEYAYSAGGEWRGRRAFLSGRIFYSVEECETWLKTVVPGSPTTVWYDPRNPGASALVVIGPELLRAVILGLTGVMLVLFGVFSQP